MDVELAGAIVPYVGAVIGAYGPLAVTMALDPVPDPSASPAVIVGRQVIARLVGAAPEVRTAVEDLVFAPHSEECLATLRWQVLRAFAAHPKLAEELAGTIGFPTLSSAFGQSSS